MELLRDPQAWLSFLALTALEIVLGIDNIIFLSVLVNRLPQARRRSGRLLGLGFAMLTRLALLFSISWLTTLRRPLLRLWGADLSGRDLVLFAGGLFLVVKSATEIREMLGARRADYRPGPLNGFWAVILQIGLIDIVFSLDSVFTAIGLAQRIEVMAAAIVGSVLFMMWVASAVGEFIERYPSIKVLALAFLALIGGALIAESWHREIPLGYLYFAMAFAAVVEWINIRVRRSAARR